MITREQLLELIQHLQAQSRLLLQVNERIRLLEAGIGRTNDLFEVMLKAQDVKDLCPGCANPHSCCVCGNTVNEE